MAAFIVASLLWLPSDCTGRIVAADAGPAEVSSASAKETDMAETVEAATRSTPPTGQFSVHMILPFSKSSIRYSYTEPTSLASTARTSGQTVDVDQAHSMSVSPYGCGTVNNSGGGGGGQRKRKRVRWKTTTPLPAEADDDEQSDGVTTRGPTNTLVPLPGYPTAESANGMVFEAAAEQLDKLYTVSRLASTASGVSDGAEGANGKGDTTDAAEDSTVK